MSIDYQIKDHVKYINSSSISRMKFYPEGRTCRLCILGRSGTDRRQACVTHNYVHWGCKSTLKTSINGRLFGTRLLFCNFCTRMCEQKVLQYISSIMQCFNSDSHKVHSGYYFCKRLTIGKECIRGYWPARWPVLKHASDTKGSLLGTARGDPFLVKRFKKK
jgi:hypothetical protein